jgi:hypothetical protein
MLHLTLPSTKRRKDNAKKTRKREEIDKRKVRRNIEKERKKETREEGHESCLFLVVGGKTKRKLPSFDFPHALSDSCPLKLGCRCQTLGDVHKLL